MSSLVLGVGGRADSPQRALLALVDSVLAGVGEGPERVGVVATVDRRADDPAVRALAARLGARLAAFPSETLAAQQVPHPSVSVARHTGTPSVAEAAVLAAGADLTVPRTTDGRWTVALGHLTRPTTTDDQESPA